MSLFQQRAIERGERGAERGAERGVAVRTVARWLIISAFGERVICISLYQWLMRYFFCYWSYASLSRCFSRRTYKVSVGYMIQWRSQLQQTVCWGELLIPHFDHTNQLECEQANRVFQKTGKNNFYLNSLIIKNFN